MPWDAQNSELKIPTACTMFNSATKKKCTDLESYIPRIGNKLQLNETFSPRLFKMHSDFCQLAICLYVQF